MNEAKVREKPILFSAAMVNAILSGRKTQTRRVTKYQPDDTSVISAGWYTQTVVRHREECPGDEVYGFADEDAGCVCPYGAPGDRLWVREAWHADRCFDFESPSRIQPDCDRWYPADDSYRAFASYGKVVKGKKRASIFMPRWASRITLEVTDVRVERLNAISVTDAVAEGVTYLAMNGPRDAIRLLWESIHGEGSWEKNPWVWVIEFRDISKEIET